MIGALVGSHLTTKSRQFRKLTDRIIEGAIDFAEGAEHVFWDSKVHGLRIRLGRRRHTWSFFRQGRARGKRYTVARRLGFYPAMGIVEARKAALALAGAVAQGKPMIGKRQALTLDAAVADYIESLRTRGKRAASVRRIERALQIHLLPEFGRWSLAELSDNPQIIRDWHKKVSKHAPVSANRVATMLYTVYRHAARLDRSLPPMSPISGVTKNKEEPAQTALPFDQYPAWRAAVEKLPRIRQGYYRFLLLTGLRGQDAQRLRWADVNLKQRAIAIIQQKTGKSFSIPMTSAILSALKLARGGHADFVFWQARKWNDDLPAKGHALRHSYISVAHDIGVNEIQVRLLVGHSLTGVHASYLTRLVMEGGSGLRGAQRAVSRRMVTLMSTPLR